MTYLTINKLFILNLGILRFTVRKKSFITIRFDYLWIFYSIWTCCTISNIITKTRACLRNWRVLSLRYCFWRFSMENLIWYLIYYRGRMLCLICLNTSLQRRNWFCASTKSLSNVFNLRWNHFDFFNDIWRLFYTNFRLSCLNLVHLNGNSLIRYFIKLFFIFFLNF